MGTQPLSPVHTQSTPGTLTEAAPGRYSPRETGRLVPGTEPCPAVSHRGSLGQFQGNTIYFGSAGPRTRSRWLGSAGNRLSTVPRGAAGPGHGWAGAGAGTGTEREGGSGRCWVGSSRPQLPRAAAPHSPALSPRLGCGGGRGTVRGSRGEGRLLGRRASRGWAWAHGPLAAAARRRHRTAPGSAAFPWRPHHRDAGAAGRAVPRCHVTGTSAFSPRSGPCRSRSRQLCSSPAAARAIGSALQPPPVPSVQLCSRCSCHRFSSPAAVPAPHPGAAARVRAAGAGGWRSGPAPR